MTQKRWKIKAACFYDGCFPCHFVTADLHSPKLLVVLLLICKYLHVNMYQTLMINMVNCHCRHVITIILAFTSKQLCSVKSVKLILKFCCFVGFDVDLGRNHSSFEVSSQHCKGDSFHHRLLSRNLLETFVLWLLFLNFIVSNFDLLILRSDNLAIRPGWNITKPPALIFLVMWVLVATLLTLLCFFFYLYNHMGFN